MQSFGLPSPPSVRKLKTEHLESTYVHAVGQSSHSAPTIADGRAKDGDRHAAATPTSQMAYVHTPAPTETAGNSANTTCTPLTHTAVVVAVVLHSNIVLATRRALLL